MRNIFERRDPWGQSPAVWIVAVLAFLAPFGWWSLRQIDFDHDLASWLSATDPDRQTLREFQTLFPADERLLVSWDDSSLGDPRVDALVRKFDGITDRHGIKRDGLKEVADVIEPKQLLRRMQAEDIEPQEAARRLHGTVLGAGPLKVKLTAAGRQRFRKTRADLGKAFRKQFGVRIDMRDPVPNLADLAAIPAPAAEDAAESTPTAPAVLTPAGQLANRESVEHDLQLVWPGMAPGSARTQEIVEFLLAFCGPQAGAESTTPPLIENCFFVIGAPIALSVGISEAGQADQAATLEAIRTAAESVGIARETLHVGGSLVVNELLHRELSEAVWNPAEPITNLPKRSILLLSLLAGAAAALLMVRSIRLASMVLAISALAAGLSLAIASAAGVEFNLILVPLPVMLLAISLSIALRVIDHWKHACVENPATAAAQTLRTAYGPCLAVGIATAACLAALCLSPLTPIRQFGASGAVGVLVSMVVVLYGLPALLTLVPAVPPTRQELEHRGWRELGRRLTLRPTLQAMSFLLIAGACAVGLIRMRTDAKSIRYFRDQSVVGQDGRFLEDQVAGTAPVELLIRFDAGALDRANFLERMELVRGVEERLRGHADMTGCLSLADYQPVTEIPSVDSGMMTLSRFHKRAGVTQGRIRDGELPEAAAYYRYQPAPAATATNWDRQPLGSEGEEIWRIASQAHVLSNAKFGTMLAEVDRATREVLRYQPGAHHVITGVAPLAMQTQAAALVSLARAFGIAFALLLVAFLVQWRDLRAAFVGMIPNLLPIPVVFGIMGWSGQPIDLGAMLTAALAVCLAADGTLHFVAVYRRELAEGIARNSAIVRALEKCGPVMWQTRIAIVCALVMLLFAELPLVSRFGGIAAGIVGLSLLSQVVLLPQLISGPLGRWFTPLPASKHSRPAIVHSAEAVVPPAPHMANVTAPSEAAGSHPRGSSDGA